jgi:hypothetical protein
MWLWGATAILEAVEGRRGVAAAMPRLYCAVRAGRALRGATGRRECCARPLRVRALAAHLRYTAFWSPPIVLTPEMLIVWQPTHSTRSSPRTTTPITPCKVP